LVRRKQQFIDTIRLSQINTTALGSISGSSDAIQNLFDSDSFPTRKTIFMKELSSLLTRVRSAGSACQSGSSILLLKARIDCIFFWAVVFIGLNPLTRRADLEADSVCDNSAARIQRCFLFFSATPTCGEE
jgi:hypothetical protein